MLSEKNNGISGKRVIERLFAFVFITLTVFISFILGYMLGSSGSKPEKKTVVASRNPIKTERQLPEVSEMTPSTSAVKDKNPVQKPETEPQKNEELKPDEGKLKEALFESTKKEKDTISTAETSKEKKLPETQRKEKLVVSKGQKGYHYSIQVGAFRKQSQAISLKKRLQAKGYSANIVFPKNKDGFYRVRIGHYKDKKTAETLALKLARTEKLSPLVVKEND